MPIQHSLPMYAPFLCIFMQTYSILNRISQFAKIRKEKEKKNPSYQERISYR